MFVSMTPSCDVGILGGGQLGRMLCQAASPMDVKVAVMDPSRDCPAASVAHRHVVGDLRNMSAVTEFARRCGVLTVEMEKIDSHILEAVAKQGVRVEPSPACIRVIQDKYLQKLHFKKETIPVAEFLEVKDMDSLERAGEKLGYPLMLKLRRLAYDGRGNAVAGCKKELLSAVALLGGLDRGLYVEKFLPFEKELAVMVARGRNGEIQTYPVVETIQAGNICRMVQAPADIPNHIKDASTEIAENAVGSLEGAGVFGVELFLIDGGQILLNEVAPRPHNSGHYTIEACYASQFEQHIRAILGLPLGDTTMKVPAAAMYNLLGLDADNGGENVAREDLRRALGVPGASVHWYNKAESKRDRKLGHITVTGPSSEAVKTRFNQVLMTSNKNNDTNESGVSVGIIMGSDSDLRVMKHAAQVLDSFGVQSEVNLISAHRTADRLFEYARNAHTKDLKVIIAGAGGSAHLPGMAGSMTPIGIIGVPINATSLLGIDSLLSIVQMPKGVPVATVSVDDAKGAGMLAIRLLALSDEQLRQKILPLCKNNGALDGFKPSVQLPISCVGRGTPAVGILVGSVSDLQSARDAGGVLRSFSLQYEIVPVSSVYANEAHVKGIKLMIVGTAASADLPELVSSVTTVPVIGIPSQRDEFLGTLEPLLVQRKAPVAWVGIDNGVNAGLLAVRFLASMDTSLLDKMKSYQREMNASVMSKAANLRELGWSKYIKESSHANFS